MNDTIEAQAKLSEIYKTLTNLQSESARIRKMGFVIPNFMQDTILAQNLISELSKEIFEAQAHSELQLKHCSCTEYYNK